MPSGETNLDLMLSTLTVTQRPGTFAVTTLPSNSDVMLGAGVHALISEAEGITVVASSTEANHRKWDYDFEAAWLSLDVHSSLEAVGLTAAFAKALGAEGISCNVLAGYFHDHLLVPVDRAADAIACLEGLAR